MPGMKNPAVKDYVAYFELCNSGVRLGYKPVGAEPNFPTELAKLPADESGDENPTKGGGTRRRKNRKYRKTRRL
jgi:hypothetical protein